MQQAPNPNMTCNNAAARAADEMARYRAALRRRPQTLREYALWLALAPIALFSIEGALSETALITPANPVFLNGMRAIGVALGLIIALTRLARIDKGKGYKAATLVISTLLFGLAFNAIAWRMADWWEFGFSGAQWESAEYPVRSASKGRGMLKPALGIDPFHVGEETELPIPREQYGQYHINVRDYCVTVQQRRSASGAIEIRTKGQYASPVEPLVLRRCR